jgi:type II secretory pathway pseudopilin PulG
VKTIREGKNRKTGFTPSETMATRIPLRGGGGVLTGFTIVELLTVMSIIVILISLLVPGLTRVRRYATLVKQKAQFHAIGIGLESFSAENDGYPDSNAYDGTYPTVSPFPPYCGAMKLCEAMVGQDLKGFNPKSRFLRRDFGSATCYATPEPGMLYPPVPPAGCLTTAQYNENIKSRKMYIQLENANAYQLASIYDPNSAGFTTSGFDQYTFVLCDVYNRVTNKDTGKKIGMPILYYKADSTKSKHNAAIPTDWDKNIYDFHDNVRLVDIGIPWNTYAHPMAEFGFTETGTAANPQVFYKKTCNTNVTGYSASNPSTWWPYRADSYILMSAGFDGVYGTADDVFNFAE